MQANFQRKKWLSGLLDLVIPPLCRVCNTRLTPEEEGICRPCLATVVYVCSPLCRICGRNFPEGGRGDHICEGCLRIAPKYCMARAIAYYAEPVSHLLHRLKYGFDTTTLPALLKIAQSYDFSSFQHSDIIIPVPLHPKRLKQRGFNHALSLANLFFPEKKDSIDGEVLLRVRDTLSQTTLDGVARRKNLKQAFCVKNKNVIVNKVICLVDDVFTTGTTAGECAQTLIGAGAREVMVVTMARVKEK